MDNMTDIAGLISDTLAAESIELQIQCSIIDVIAELTGASTDEILVELALLEN